MSTLTASTESVTIRYMNDTAARTPRTTARYENGRPVYVGEGAVRQQGSKKLYECNTCHRDVVWLTSKRTGKVYLASVYSGEVSRYYVSQPHDCKTPEPIPEPDPYTDALRILGEHFITNKITRDEYIAAALELEKVYGVDA